MRTLQFHGTVTAMRSISHNGGETLGITSKMRREKFVLADGSVEEIPVISGNGIRGVLRDRGMLEMCRALGYGVNDETGEVRGLSLPAFYFLFSGGTLTGGAGGGLDIDLARRIQTLIPLASVFGGAVAGQIMPGKLICGKMIPIAQETLHLIPEKFHVPHPASFWDLLQEEMYVRKDDEKNERLRGMLSDVQRNALSGVSTTIHEKGENPQQMMYYVETLAAGTQFYWRLELHDVTDLEFEAFIAALVAFSKAPYIGGKHNIGLGEISIKFDSWIEINSRVSGGSAEITVPLGRAYQQHLESSGEEIRALLAALR